MSTQGDSLEPTIASMMTSSKGIIVDKEYWEGNVLATQEGEYKGLKSSTKKKLNKDP
jgi:hypothetical protein